MKSLYEFSVKEQCAYRDLTIQEFNI